MKSMVEIGYGSDNGEITLKKSSVIPIPKKKIVVSYISINNYMLLDENYESISMNFIDTYI